MCKTIHAFEQAGLGLAPFRFIGMIEQEESPYDAGTVKAGIIGGCEIHTQPGGTCDFCGTFIIDMFKIRSADDKTFKVGSDCLLKTGDAGLIKLVPELKKKAAKARKEAREAELIRRAKEAFQSRPSLFRDEPHPNAYWAKEGKTKRDYMQWCWDNDSTLNAARIILRAIETI